ncbi:MAG: DUF1194 domain-containing protein [Marinibacterium sp.]
MPGLRAFLLMICLALPGRLMACDLALVLAVDVSGSVDRDEYRLQMDGLAAALRDPVVSEALVRGQARLMLIQWSGSSRQAVSVPWTDMTDFDTLDRFALQVAADPRRWRNYATAIGEALSFALAAFPAERKCSRRLIDLSGDGLSNEGVLPTEVHPALRAAGVSVNALAIEASEPDLTGYFFENVLTGNGAFVVSATDFMDYPQKIRKKLLREVTKQTSFLMPVDNSAPQHESLSRN